MYIGVDGGGTKTAFALVSAEGRLLATHTAATCSHLSVGLDGAKAVLEQGVKALLARAHVPLAKVTHAFFGLPTYGEDSAVTPLLDALPIDLFPLGNYRCDNDMINAWAGSLCCQDGINIIAGTGSMTYGENAGRGARCGGWGELFGDEGSAYWIGRAGLALFSKMSDGRVPRSQLYTIFRDYFGRASDLDISGVVLGEWKGERNRIAALCQEVSIAAEAGDLLAQGIFNEAAAELADIVDSTRRTLAFKEGQVVAVSYSGGVFAAGEIVFKPFKLALAERYGHYELAVPRFSPALGAAIYAARLAGVRLDESALSFLAYDSERLVG
ncbi:BadF/BadG/BcrA/BcrD ATPase family protein [Pseudokordiimonas caeni]|uniref:BadF/BadG/BcrA/BcrD ATPase family protein n=1 Tax=Pseudokordiimonas caeni TaxID=2997908 RepID=UPI0028114EC5|nr:BadF/BadG/BcrA/BcrD ATPase family protein [Pseudokordiimonas caeni]